MIPPHDVNADDREPNGRLRSSHKVMRRWYDADPVATRALVGTRTSEGMRLWHASRSPEAKQLTRERQRRGAIRRHFIGTRRLAGHRYQNNHVYHPRKGPLMPGIRRVGQYLQEIAHGLFQDPTFVEKLTASVRTGCEAGDPFFLSLLLKVTDGITEPLVEPSRERYAVMTTDELLTLHGIYTPPQEPMARNNRPTDRP